MADAKKCDRCGEFYDPHVHNREDIDFNVCERTQFGESGHAFLVQQKDLCDKCHAELFAFIHQQPVTRYDDLSRMTWYGLSYDEACDVLAKYVSGMLKEADND